MMPVNDIMFYVIATLILSAALAAVLTRNLFRSAIFLLLSMAAVAAFYFWIDVLFIAAVQVIVYVGGIVVLIIFSIFLTQKAGDRLPVATGGRMLISALTTIAGAALFLTMVMSAIPVPASTAVLNSEPSTIGTALLDPTQTYLLPFEVVSLLLLAAMIGCIVIAMKTAPVDAVAPVPGAFEISVNN
jgi:NADH-quinone oxidoreductase subunit J